MNRDVIRIGNAGGYWGDDPKALERQVTGGKLDYITMDFLAEITMSILQKQRAKDPDLGYARDFIEMLRPTLKAIVEQGTTVITNAGGINPRGCAEVIYKLGKELDLELKIAVVEGDNILDRLDLYVNDGIRFDNMETGADFTAVRENIESANVYFGAAAVVEALKWQPHIIVTGRVTDTGITLAPMIYEFGWSLDDWDKLASGIVAGHILECGTQSTGGNFTDWRLVESFDDVGYPIVEVHRNAELVITKHPGSGGLVSVDTVREQLFYEMGDPKVYITPDVIADFTSIQLSQEDSDRVRVRGVKGCEPTALYKVSMAYRDGFKAVGSIIISGPEARAKSEAFANIFWRRCHGNFDETITEYVGWNSCHRSLVQTDDGCEITLRLGVRGQERDDIQRFGKLVPSLILSGPPGVAVLGGVPKPQQVISYWPALMPKEAINPVIVVYEQGQFKDERPVSMTVSGNFQPKDSSDSRAAKPTQTMADIRQEFSESKWRPLGEICLARSGDKGDTSNIGVMARSKAAYQFIKEFLTADKMKSYFQELCLGEVKRYDLENLQGFNFLLEEALGGGGTKTLRIDAQGKTFAQALLRQKAPIPDEVLQSIPSGRTLKKG